MEVIIIPGLGFSSNVFLVKGEKKNILVDAGLGETVDYVLEVLKETGTKIDIIFLTHRHCDHIGGAKALVEATGAELLAPSIEADAIREADNTTGASLLGVRLEPTPVRGVEEGFTIDLGDHTLEMIDTPGHTVGGAALYEPEEKVLFSGDTVFGGGDVGRWDLPTGNYDDLLASVERLAALGAEMLYPGHGPAEEVHASKHIQRSLMGLRRWRM
ncbi:MAG: MBL fold metallo-hydrolase [Thermoplasmata archaeon]|nr:MBL fold metallo-hydrolase [Thermoplasmata archaeon]